MGGQEHLDPLHSPEDAAVTLLSLSVGWWAGGVGPLSAPSKVEIQLSAVCFVVPRGGVGTQSNYLCSHPSPHRPQQDNPIGSTNIVCSSHHPVLTS